MAKYLDSNGLSHLIGKIKTAIAGLVPNTRTVNGKALSADITLTASDVSALPSSTAIPAPGTGSSYPAMDGTRALGSNAGYARVDHVHPSDTSRVPTSRTVNGKALSADITLSASDIADLKIFTGVQITYGSSSTSVFADSENDSLGLIAGTGIKLEANSTTDSITISDISNKFSKVKVGDSTIYSDAVDDTLELVAGSNVTLTPDTTNDKVTIAGTDTKNTAGSTDSSSKLYLIGATSQAANPQTYSQDTAYIGTDGHLYSNSKQVVNLSDSQALTNKTYNGYTLGAACAKAVDSSISSGSSSTNLPTSEAVASFVAGQIAGASTFQGTLVQTDSGSSATKWTQSELEAASYKKGWYWVVEAAGTYAGNVMEVGDMLFCVSSKSSAYAAADFTAIQNNIETLTTTEIDTIWAAA